MDSTAIQDVFAIFADDERSNMVKKEYVVPLLRSVGYVVDEEEMDIDAYDDNGYLSMDDVCEIVRSNGIRKITEDQIVSAFEVFDKNKTGKISISQMKQILQHGSTALTSDEIDAAIELFNPNPEGIIEYVRKGGMRQTE